MQFVSKLSPEQWAEARSLRAGGATYPQIAARFGLSPRTVSDRARREGWSTAAPAAAAPVRPRAGTASRGTAAIRSRLALRLYNVIECRIRLMEMRMQRQLQAHTQADGPGPDAGIGASIPPPPTKDERDSFAALIASINQVTEMASDPAPAADGRRTTAARAAARSVNPELTALSDDLDPDGLAAASQKDEYRRELAEHLGRMFPKP
jgi:hypothetical protein